ncbi:MAG: hypothetical protein HY040_07150 [Planctomycetes bacterium]|nr:hypothetical protein [Planctomycetota bacterium]
MAKKVDFAALKERFKKYMFNHGERVGLAVCAGLAVLLIGMGVWNGLTSSRPKSGEPWHKVLNAKADEVNTNVQHASLSEEKKKFPEDLLKRVTAGDLWANVLPWFQPGPLTASLEQADTRRRNPAILKTLDGEKQIQVDVVQAAVLAYEVDFKKQRVWIGKARAGGKAGTGAANNPSGLVTLVNPYRIAVISALFPVREQLEEYRKELRLPTLQALLADPSNLPKPVGLNVFRCEIKPDGKATDWEVVYRYDPEKEKIEKAERIDRLLRESQIDTDNAQMYGKYLLNGLDTMFPKLAHGSYPMVKLEGIEGKPLAEPEKKQGAEPKKLEEKKIEGFPTGKNPVKGGGEPGKLGGGGDTGQGVWDKVDVPWNSQSVSKDLQEKFKGEYELFNPFAKGTQPDKKGFTGEFGGGLGGGGRFGKEGKEGKEGKDPKKDTKDITEIPDLLVRFFDVGLEPGKTYRYCVQVRMHNPNFERKDVAFEALAKVKELYSPFAVTPEVRVPPEYHFYAVDQQPEVPIRDGPDFKLDNPGGRTPRVPIQVHRWVESIPKEFLNIGDWAVAERLLVRKGDFIGRNGVYVEMPVWMESKDKFELYSAPRGPKARPGDKFNIGVPVDFQGPSLLVDFSGGRKDRDESAVEVLVLTPEGKLVVRNSRIDAEDDNPIGKDRKVRYDAWREHVSSLRSGGGASGRGGVVMPGLGAGKKD